MVAQEAARHEAARQEAARAQVARAAQSAKDDEERREAARRAIGRQLDAEAASRASTLDASRLPDTRPSSWSSARRGRLLGRSDPNVELVLYAEAWARRIQLNTAFDTIRPVVQRPHTRPMVTVAVRRDGSIESVTFVVGSGVPEVDELIRRIVHGLAPHPQFPPPLANEFDVIEIRRTWHFDGAVRLY